MGNTLEEEIIRTRIPVQNYYLVVILKFLFICLMLVVFLYDYSKYYINTGIIVNIDNVYYLKVKVLLDDVFYVRGNNVINIDGEDYEYCLCDFDDYLYIDTDSNYKYLYLNIEDIPHDIRQENYILDFSIELEKKKIIKYLLDYLEGR